MKKFRHISSLALSLALIGSVTAPLNANAVILYSNDFSDSVLVLDYKDVVNLVDIDGNESLATSSFFPITKVDKAPETDEEITEYVKKYKHYYFQLKGDDSYIFHAVPVFKEDSSQNIIEKYKIEKKECNSKVEYTIDVSKGEVRDYKTNDILSTFDDNVLTFYYGGVHPLYPDFPATYSGQMFNFKTQHGEALSGEVSLEELMAIYPHSDQNTKPQSIEYGDINADSEIDLSDLTMLSLHLLGDKNLTEEKLKYADCNGDGTVNLADLAHFKQYISKDNVTLGPVS